VCDLCAEQEEEEEEDEEDEDSFLDDDDEDHHQASRRELQELCRAFAKGRNYWEDEDDFDDAAMEVSWRDALAEENRRFVSCCVVCVSCRVVRLTERVWCVKRV
jgi:hypothetical protein